MTESDRADNELSPEELRSVHRQIYLQLIEQNTQMRERLKERTRQLRTAREQRDDARRQLDDIKDRLSDLSERTDRDVMETVRKLGRWARRPWTSR